MAYPLLELVFAPPNGDDSGAPSREKPLPLRQTLRSDAETVRLIRDGDERVFTDVVHDLAVALQAYAYGYVHSVESAADITQDVFTRLWERRATLVVNGTLRQYLFVATRLRALELLRRHRLEDARAGHLDLKAAEPPLDDELERLDRFVWVTRAVDELPPRQREIVRLRWIEGLTNPLVAQRLGISVKGVEIQLTRALHTLRERLKT